MTESDENRTEEEPDGDDRSEEGGDDRADGRLSAKELTEAAMSTISDLTDFDPEAVTALEWDGDAWNITVDVLELRRIPETTDVLASYVVQLDEQGVLLGYKRTRRFHRGQIEEG